MNLKLKTLSLFAALVLAALAQQNGSAIVGIVDTKQDPVRGKDPSEWVVMARESSAFESLRINPRWRPLQARTASDAWTDDFSNVLRVFRWY